MVSRAILTVLLLLISSNVNANIRESINTGLVTEFTPQLMINGISDKDCKITVTIQVSSELKGRVYNIYEQFYYDDLCLLQQVEHEIRIEGVK